MFSIYNSIELPEFDVQMLHTNSSKPLLFARDFSSIAKYTSVKAVTEIFNTQAAARYGNKRHCCENK